MHGLVKGSWEAINQVVLARLRDQRINQDLNGQLVGHELALAHNASNFFTFFGSLLSEKAINIDNYDLPSSFLRA